jgi:Domain of unknown function (DUF4136)
MKLVACVIALLLSAGQLPPKEGTVATLKDPKADFTRFTTYTWERGQETFDRTAHKAIVSAIDAEMAARGFRLLQTGKGDVTIRYFSVLRTDVDLDKLEKMQQQNKPAPTKNLGRLVVVMRDASNNRVWAADTVQPLDSERAKAYEEIAPIVGKLFATYPGPKR